MTPPLISLKQLNKIDNLEAHIDDLIRQKEIIQKIEEYTYDKIDFGDLLETYNLLVEEIEKLQKQLREGRECLPVPGEIKCVEEEEEETDSSFSSKYSIEHVIKDEDGKLRNVKPEDLDMEKHKGVRDAFKLMYEYQKNKGYEEDEEEAEDTSNRFDIENQEKFVGLVRKACKG